MGALEEDAVTLIDRMQNLIITSGRNAEQRMPITWTACHFGEPRSWFSCAAPGDVQQPLFAIHAD
jgi:hypothetical protein